MPPSDLVLEIIQRACDTAPPDSEERSIWSNIAHFAGRHPQRDDPFGGKRVLEEVAGYYMPIMSLIEDKVRRAMEE